VIVFSMTVVGFDPDEAFGAVRAKTGDGVTDAAVAGAVAALLKTVVDWPGPPVGAGVHAASIAAQPAIEALRVRRRMARLAGCPAHLWLISNSSPHRHFEHPTI